jgi:uncharacterized delta-60 repeat protein
MRNTWRLALWLVLAALLASCVVPASWAQNDPSFNAQVEYYIHAMIPRPDGKVLVAGDLISLNGVWRDRIGLLNSDGSLDPGFNPDTNGVVYAAVMLTNGQVVVGGNFSTFGGLPRASLARLNPDGTVDPAFTNGLWLEVDALALQADGKILVGGYFTNLAGQPRQSLGRLNADGSLDATFNPDVGPANSVYSLAVQPDGRILVGGYVQSIGGQPVNNICRLHPNGTLDTNFTASPNGLIYSLAVQPDGKILAGGPFYLMNGESRYGIARLNTNGTLDTNFTGTVAPNNLGEVTTISLQCDGKIVAGGGATGWFAYPYFARFHPDGTLDTSFVVNAPTGVRSAVIQRDGKILRAAQHSLARMTNAPATESLIYSNSIITWLRGGSAPEAWRTTFEYSTNRTNWTFIGSGTRVAGGWQRTGVSAPTNALLRARAFTTGGFFNSSSWFTESYVGPVMIISQPASRTNNATTTATFSVVADGTPTLTYRWRKNGTNLSNGGNISGATNTTLTLTNVLKADAAAYTVVVSNKYGAITSAVANLTVLDPFIVTPPSNQMINVGGTAQFNVVAAGTSSLKYRWLKNGGPLVGQTNTSLTISNAQAADSGSLFRVVITNASGAITSAPALLTVNVVTVDALNPQPNYEVYSVAVQPDAKILLAGNFSAFNGQGRSGVARLNTDGTVDTNFPASLVGIAFSPAEEEVAVQSDGKIVLAGGISYVNGATRERIGRLNIDGSLDIAFNPGAGPEIFAMTAQPDGKLLFAGSFTNLAGQARNRIGRLNSDGMLDTNFAATADGTIYAVAVQPDGKALVGGNFTLLGGQARNNVGRLNANGTLDTNFVASADATVKAIAVLTNGSIAIGGDFTTLNGQPRSRLGRLGTNGVLDATFNPAADGSIETLAVEVGGRLVVGGTFTSIGGHSRTNLALLNTDGTAEMTFNPGADGTVGSVAIQPDGKILVAGAFGTLNGQPRPFIGRLNATVAATNNLTFNASTITWQRSGAGPEVWMTTFDVTTNGTDWAHHIGTRTGSGWQVSGLSLPGNPTIRARGFVSGSSDGSSWFIESSLGPAVILGQPVSRTNTPFTLAQFSVEVAGAIPVTFQWLKNGSPLTDAGNISGSQTALLSVGNVLGSDAASYQVVVSNASLVVTSAVATLTVIDPLLISQPVSQTNNAGTMAAFTVNASGTTNLSYQWLKNGTNLTDGGNVSGAQSPMLTLGNVSGSFAGDYRAVVTNIWGGVTSAVATLTVVDPLLVTNPVAQLVNRGQTATFGVFVRGEEPLSYQWRKNGANLLLTTNATLVLTNVQAADSGSFDVIASNSYGSVTSAVAMLTVNIAVPEATDLVINGNAYAMALQPDGKILLGGIFTSVAGQTRNRIARLNADGTLDTAFNPNARGNATAGVFSFALQPDGKILVGGTFTNIGGVNCSNLARLNPDGSLDSAFTPNPTYFYPGSSRVMSLLVQPDGKIVLGGVFTMIGGTACSFIGRLHPDGSADTNFQATADSFVTTLVAQADGKILIGGSFSSLNGQPRNHLGRLNPDGSLDTTFTNTPNSYIAAIANQSDGGILIGGSFNEFDGQPRNGIARIAPDGLLDAGFAPSTGNTIFAPLADGRIVLGSMSRLNADGSIDANYNPTPNGNVFSVIAQPDGKILAAGSFTTMGGQPHSRFARLNDGGVSTESIFSDATSLTWLRGGAGPELARASFETTTNGTTWTPLGEGSRIPGGWQRSGLTLPPNAVIRARGFAGSSGLQSSSEWFVESIGGGPMTITQPLSQTNNANTTATFNISAIGAAPMIFQWLKHGTNLGDGGNVVGATTATLTVSDVFGADAGAYSVVLSNVTSVVTSTVAMLSVIDPFIVTHPTSQSVNGGQSATFNVTVNGSTPLNFQWRRDGVELAGANTATLTLTNLQAANAGNYDVVITNGFGVATSSIAALTVNLAVPDSFNPGANGPIYALALQPDGKILVGGAFTNLGGQLRRNIGRLNPDGTVDATFANNSNFNNYVTALLVQPDGRILAGGFWSEQNRAFITGLWRLDAGGNLETVYTNHFTSSVNALAFAPDGKVWVGGTFIVFKPGFTTNLARLNADGSFDSNFVATANGGVNTLALQADGKLAIGGAFTTVNGTNRNRLARFNTDGTLDTNFNPNANGTVNTLAVQPDGKIILGGSFTTVAGSNRSRLARLNADGTLDESFAPLTWSANGGVSTLALQVDGRILIGGGFTAVNGQTRNRLARLNADGSLDATFNPGANNTVNTFAIQSDGAIIVGGGAVVATMTQLGGQSRTNIGRLVNTAPATHSFTFDGSTATWQRDGTGPEFWRATFEGSTNGVDWISLGHGTWITNGWQWAGANFPLRSMIRARGFVTGGANTGSGWFAEIVNPGAVPPEMLLGNARLGVRGVSGQVVVVEATMDFIGWVPLQTNVVTSLGEFLFADLEAGLYPRRFYRARVFDGTLPPPAIGSAPTFSESGFGFDLAGTAGQTFVVETSTNLSLWTPLATNTLATSTTNFFDFSATNWPWNFYRLRLPSTP